MSYTYNSFVTALANMIVVPAANPEFVAILPSIIDDAEQRIYRELDLLATIVTDATQRFVINDRNFTIPGSFVVIENINCIQPTGYTNQLLPTSKEMLNATYPSVAGSGIPQYFAMITQSTIIVGPWPDSNYVVEVVGTQRPAPLSASNQTTFLSVNLPDLFFAASLVFAAAFQKNFSEMGDQPQAASAFEAHYQLLLKSAATEEARKKFTAEGWSSKEPSPLATPPRT